MAEARKKTSFPRLLQTEQGLVLLRRVDIRQYARVGHFHLQACLRVRVPNAPAALVALPLQKLGAEARRKKYGAGGATASLRHHNMLRRSPFKQGQHCFPAQQGLVAGKIHIAICSGRRCSKAQTGGLPFLGRMVDDGFEARRQLFMLLQPVQGLLRGDEYAFDIGQGGNQSQTTPKKAAVFKGEQQLVFSHSPGQPGGKYNGGYVHDCHNGAEVKNLTRNGFSMGFIRPADNPKLGPDGQKTDVFSMGRHMTPTTPAEARTNIAQILGLRSGDRVCIVGSGGKSTLMSALAGCFPSLPVLLGTTTKIFAPSPQSYRAFLDQSAAEALLGAWAKEGLAPAPGIYLACGRPVSSDSGQGAPSAKPAAPSKRVMHWFHEARNSLPMLPSDAFAKSVDEAMAAYKLLPLPDRTYELLSGPDGPFPLLLLEADGSRMLPLKGWGPQEPLVPDFATATIGVIPVRLLGRPLDFRHVHRWPIFKELSGLREGEVLRADHLAAVISGSRGLFAHARGRKILFFSQIEDAVALDQAASIVDALPPETLADLDCIAAGSARHGRAIGMQGSDMGGPPQCARTAKAIPEGV